MLKSEMFKKAQFAVLNDDTLGMNEKLDILKMLMGEEIVERYSEKDKKQGEAHGKL